MKVFWGWNTIGKKFGQEEWLKISQIQCDEVINNSLILQAQGLYTKLLCYSLYYNIYVGLYIKALDYKFKKYEVATCFNYLFNNLT